MVEVFHSRTVHLIAWLQRRGWWILSGVVIAGALAAWRYGSTFWAVVSDEQALEAFIASLGWIGPLALVAINVAQIVVAPIPGYVMQAAAGYLYGPFWGGVWGALGLLIGSMLAMALARIFGRPLVLRLVSAERLARWERVTHSDSTVIWFMILLAPTGDLPYFMAGLAQVSFTKIFVLTLMISRAHRFRGGCCRRRRLDPLGLATGGGVCRFGRAAPRLSALPGEDPERSGPQSAASPFRTGDIMSDTAGVRSARADRRRSQTSHA